MTQPSLHKEDITEQELELLRMLNNEAIGPDKQWSYSSARQGFHLHNQMVRKIARDRNLPVIDLDAGVPKTTEYFNDDVHYTTKGFDLVAQYIYKELQKKNAG